MIRSSFDHEALFQQVTGRVMRREDADELRRLRAHMPAALADSPSYNFNLIVTYDQMHKLRSVVAGASDAIIDDVEHQSMQAVTRLVDDAVKRIHDSSPSETRAFYEAVSSVAIITAVVVALTFGAVVTVLGKGWVRPQWFTAEYSAKVSFADTVEDALGTAQVDWARREGEADQSLTDVIKFAEQRGTEADPYRRISDHEACQGPGQVAYPSRGQTMCKFEVVAR